MSEEEELPELPPRVARAAKSWRPGMTGTVGAPPDPSPFRPPRRFDNAEELGAAGEDPGATFMPGSTRLGEGDGFLSRKVRERRAAGVDIDNMIASAFVEGFRGMAPGSFDARGYVGGVDAKAILEERARAAQEARRPRPREVPATAEVLEVARDDKPVLELLAVNPPHPSELAAAAERLQADLRLMDTVLSEIMLRHGMRTLHVDAAHVGDAADTIHFDTSWETLPPP